MSKVRPFSRQWFTPKAVHATCNMLKCCVAMETRTKKGNMLGLGMLHTQAQTFSLSINTRFLLKLLKLRSMAAALICLK